MIAVILGILLALIPGSKNAPAVIVIPPMPQAKPKMRDVSSPLDVLSREPMPVILAPVKTTPVTVNDEDDWGLYHAEAYAEYAAEFTALFESYETKRARNGALMIRKGNSGSYRFAKKG